MTKKRISRDEEIREFNTRDTDLRPEYNFDYVNPYDLPAGVYREGYNYHWGRYSIRGNSDNNKIEKLRRAKWELVPASRSTEQFLDPLGQNPFSGQYIYVDQYLLFERPEIFGQHEDEYWNRETVERTRAASAQISEDRIVNANSSRF